MQPLYGEQAITVAAATSPRLRFPRRSAGGKGYALTPSQENNWFNWIHGCTPQASFALRFPMLLDKPSWAKAFAAFASRHAILGRRFVVTDNEAFPHAVESGGVAELAPWRELAAEALPAAMAAELRQWLDPLRGPLLRCLPFNVHESGTPSSTTLLVHVHHLVWDGASTTLFERECAALYRAAREGRDAALPPASDYWETTHAQERLRVHPSLAQRQTYWRNVFAPPLSPLHLHGTVPRPSIAHEMQAHHFMLSGNARAMLASLARQTISTPFVVAMALLKWALYLFGGNDEIVVTEVAADRIQAASLNAVGPFNRPIPVRTSLRGDPTFSELVTRVRANCLGGRRHALSYPDFARLLTEHCSLPLDAWRQVRLNYFPYQQGPLEWEPGIPVTRADLNYVQPWFCELMFVMREGHDSVALQLLSAKERYRGDAPHRLAAQLDALLGMAARNSSVRLSQGRTP